MAVWNPRSLSCRRLSSATLSPRDPCSCSTARVIRSLLSRRHRATGERTYGRMALRLRDRGAWLRGHLWKPRDRRRTGAGGCHPGHRRDARRHAGGEGGASTLGRQRSRRSPCARSAAYAPRSSATEEAEDVIAVRKLSLTDKKGHPRPSFRAAWSSRVPKSEQTFEGRPPPERRYATVSIERPAQRPTGEWVCSYRVRALGVESVDGAAGLDSIQRFKAPYGSSGARSRRRGASSTGMSA